MSRLLRQAAPLIATLVLSSCCDPQHPRTPPTFETRSPQTRAADPLSTIPIIDIHAHTFNGRYLPLVNIATGKRDKTWFTQLFPDSVVVAAAQYLNDVTVLSEDPDAAVEPRERHTRALDRAAAVSNLPKERLKNEPAITGIQKIVAAQGDPGTRGAPRRVPDEALTPDERAALKCLGIFGEIDFIAALVLSDDRRAIAYREDFQLGQRPILIVSHMMDLGPTYAQDAAANGLLPFSAQVRRIERFQSLPDDNRIYFVAYSPFRDGGSLDTVKDAIEHRGAYGVKVYPPSGYRPIHNEIPSRPVALFSSEPGRQWDARYAGLKDADLDQRLEALLTWCQTNDIPVFAHCNTGEMEARSGYGRRMAHPQYWLEYLKAHPAPDGGPSTLRLCLGHAGGPDFWFDKGSDSDWGSAIFELCAKYPNVYCEVGVHDEILKKSPHKAFVKKLTGLFKDSAVPSQDHPYSFSTKIMYGTDWFMPGPVNHAADYLEAYETAFAQEPLRPYYRRFFLDNAISYLNIKERLKQPGLPAAVGDRLKAITDAADRAPDPSRSPTP